MVCQFLLYNKVNQLYIYIYPHISSLLRLPPTLLIPPLQVVTKHQADLPVLCGCFPLAISFFFLIIYLFIYFQLCWVFVSVRGLSLVVASGGHSSLQCAGLSVSRPLLLRSTGSRRAGSAAVAHVPSCSAACGIFPAQGSNPCPLHWQADSQPLHHQGSPSYQFYIQQCIYVHATLSLCQSPS